MRLMLEIVILLEVNKMYFLAVDVWKKLGGISLFQQIPLFSKGGDFLWYDFY